MNRQLALPGLPEPIGPPQKRCAHCLELKALGLFSIDASRLDGFCRLCRNCDAVRNRKRWRANADRLRSKARERYDANIDRHRESAAEYARSERGELTNLAAVRRYQSKFPERVKARAMARAAIRSGVLAKPDRCVCLGLGRLWLRMSCIGGGFHLQIGTQPGTLGVRHKHFANWGHDPFNRIFVSIRPTRHDDLPENAGN